ncbi:MAG: bifunctional 4-hydroxy-2-oxoglutarate aldolase/2-dehydro-3-deoxy-phosphogluconate aldolase [Spirochaetales bacterium]|nr:bifunctional 4-hydroxy-2-oxoglutarate aldolase/2-dehydro-3-deoxy-phosphogluconate aldolase [Spirochaetales bacterium]
MNDILKTIYEYGLVPVIKIEKAEKAIPLGRTLCEAGLPVAEITFRTRAAARSIELLIKNYPDMLVGAGTVLNVEQVKQAVQAGAQFIVSPGFNPKVVGYCVENNIPVTPGINSPSQIEQALEYGLSTVKYFPAETSGGLPMLKAMSAPYADLKFIPTGGINVHNLGTYLRFPHVIACGGSWIVNADLINEDKFDQIKHLISEALCIVYGFEIMHIGINQQNEPEAINTAHLFNLFFKFPLMEGTDSLFASKHIEIMKSMDMGKKGHLAVGTNDIHRAIAYMAHKGVNVLSETQKKKNGSLISVYLDKQIAGFALRLLQK